MMEAKKDELNSIHNRAVFSLVKPPDGSKLLSAIRVFDYKLDLEEGYLIRFKGENCSRRSYSNRRS